VNEFVGLLIRVCHDVYSHGTLFPKYLSTNLALHYGKKNITFSNNLTFKNKDDKHTPCQVINTL